jgi:(1->4)-alpha-D-glucan 1-alpha-D-glucosylmutase
MDANNLTKLAETAGIETFYWDNHGIRHEASEDTIRGLLRAFGIACGNDGEVWDSLTHFWRTPWMSLVLPALTLAEDEPVAIPLRAWEEDGGRVIDWELIQENGEKREGSTRLSSLTYDDIAYFDDRRIFQHRLRLSPLPCGYHVFRVKGEETAMRLIVAPRRCYRPPGLTRAWGLMQQLYALKSNADWGIGDFTALEKLTDQIAAAGGAAIGLNPLHALFLDTPENASPYSPCSRLFRNPLYLDVTRIADFAECEPAQALVASPAFARAVAAARGAELVDYTAVTGLKLKVLELLYASFRQRHASGPRHIAFCSYVAEKGHELVDLATFQALTEHYDGRTWPHWAPAHRESRSTAVSEFRATRADRVGFYQYLQWLADDQFAAAAAHAKAKGMAVGLYNDLAVSVDASSADYWMHRANFAGGARVGAPPDPFNEKGQDWGIVPLHPLRLAETGFSYFRKLLAANMAHAGALRIDHVMGLTRLYVIPAGAKPTEGAYVRYPLQQLLAVAALESQRNRCLVIGEDLGTVPAGFREKLGEAQILSSRVLYFERNGGGFAPPSAYPELAAVSVSTHDLATLAGFWAGEDLIAKGELGLFRDAHEAESARAGRLGDKQNLLAAIAAEGLLPAGITPADAATIAWSPALTAAVHAYLSRSPATLMMVQMDDLTGQTRQANLPGSISEYPNWRRRMTAALEDLGADPKFGAALAAIGRGRV